MNEEDLIGLYEKKYRSWIGLEQFLNLVSLGQSLERIACLRICNDESGKYWIGDPDYNAVMACFNRIESRSKEQ